MSLKEGDRPSDDADTADTSLFATLSDDAVYESESEFPELRPMLRSNSASSIPFIDLNKLLLFSDFDFGMGLETVSDSAKRRLTDMKRRTQAKIHQLTVDHGSTDSVNATADNDAAKPRKPQRGISIGDVVGKNPDLLKLQRTMIDRLGKFDKRINANLQLSATEKMFYALAVFLIAVTGFIIGKYPEWFHIYHTALFCVLMPIRFYTYFKLSFQYYLADLCYYVNILVILFMWVFPSSTLLFILVFSLTMGTLLFAVITWRNLLVLHLIEKTTLSFIHIMPPVSMFVIVHEMPRDFVLARFPAVAAIESWDFVNGILWTSFYYTIWQVSYHYFITIKRREKISSGRVTSFSYLRKKNAKKGIGKFVNSLPYSWMQVAAFTLIQFGYQIATMVFCPIWFRYKHACGAFMCFIFIMALYHGATYYIDVFGKRLEKEVEKLKSEVVQLQEKQRQGSTDYKPEERDITIAQY